MSKMIDIGEFCKRGYLQEANRRFFHPLGMALVVEDDGNGNCKLVGVTDHRNDPEGIVFAPGEIDRTKYETVDEERAAKASARIKAIGTVIQTIPAIEMQPIPRVPRP